MSDEKEIKVRVSGWGEFGYWIAVAILFVAFYGDPDLVDALIFKLTNGSHPAAMKSVEQP